MRKRDERLSDIYNLLYSTVVRDTKEEQEYCREKDRSKIARCGKDDQEILEIDTT